MASIQNDNQLNLGHHLNRPWSEKFRPQNWKQFVGHAEVVRRFSERSEDLHNLILYGPPGTGKSTFAKLLRLNSQAIWFEFNGAGFSTDRLKEVLSAAQLSRVVLVVDEIHRLNKAQQDHLLEPLERGVITLIGTTTESPYHVLNRAILSRVQIVKLESLQKEDLLRITEQIVSEQLPGRPMDSILSPEASQKLISVCRGDARKLVALFGEVITLFHLKQRPLELLDIDSLIQNDEGLCISESEHFDLLSAMIKSIRGSDPDSAMMWFAYLIKSKVDPKVIARRLVISASEDIGNAEPRALSLAVDAFKAVECVGLPEVGIVLSQVIIFLSCSPKSNSAYRAYQQALRHVDQHPTIRVPRHLTPAGRSEYLNPQESPKGFVSQDYGATEKIYESSKRGFEKKMDEYLSWLKGLGSSDC